MVDFTEFELEPGTWMWIRPGQVQQWGDLTGVQGTLVLFEQDFLDPATGEMARVDEMHAPIVRSAHGTTAQAWERSVDHLWHAFRTPGPLPLAAHTATLRHLLAALVLQLSHPGTPTGRLASERQETYVQFRNAVERHFARTRRVEDYAILLGYSPRTLSRATLAASGIGAKEFIDRRVVLEAKRLLAHTDHNAGRIADQLGFPSLTHFSKYFLRGTGQAPTAFRENVRGHGSTASPTGSRES